MEFSTYCEDSRVNLIKPVKNMQVKLYCITQLEKKQFVSEKKSIYIYIYIYIYFRTIKDFLH